MTSYFQTIQGCYKSNYRKAIFCIVFLAINAGVLTCDCISVIIAPKQYINFKMAVIVLAV